MGMDMGIELGSRRIEKEDIDHSESLRNLESWKSHVRERQRIERIESRFGRRSHLGLEICIGCTRLESVMTD